MPDENTLQEIISSSVYAPSGDNSQPWEFAIGQGEVWIYNTPHSDNALFNFKQRGSYVAHGAVLENITLLAAQTGFEAHMRMFPGEECCVAHISFKAISPIPQPLCGFLQSRFTNRKPYRPDPLAPEIRTALLSSISSYKEVAFHIFEDREKIRTLAGILSFTDGLIMKNQRVHDLLFSMIRWSEREERVQPGLYVKTMELPPPVRFLFRYVLRYMPLVRVLNYFGFSKAISAQTKALYEASGAIGVIIIPDDSDESFVFAGRALQRFWLTATSIGLSLQPVAAIPYLAQRIRAGEANELSPQEIEHICSLDEHIRSLAMIDSDSEIALIFRIGYGDTPSAHSAKLPPKFRELH